MLTQIDIKRLPSYELGFEDGGMQGTAEGKAEATRAIVHKLLQRLDVDQVASFLDIEVAEARRIAGDGDMNGRS